MAAVSASVSKAALVAVVAVSLGASSCDPTQEFLHAKHRFDHEILKLLGKTPPAEKPTGSAGSDIAAQKNRANAELLHEVFRVVLLREPETPGEFGMLLGSLNQGASVEGIYNGITHSGSWRALEESYPGSTPQALATFSAEMAALQAEMASPTLMTLELAKPLPRAVEPTGDDGGTPDTIDFNVTPKVVKLPPADIARRLQGASFFTLKRILADEALRLIDEKRKIDGELPKWYAKWVVHMAALNVDFGLKLRNKADEKFHYDWARSAADDLLVWEVLNRLHRAMNEGYKKKS